MRAHVRYMTSCNNAGSAINNNNWPAVCMLSDLESEGMEKDAKADKLSLEKLVTQRRNLLGISKMCVKSLVDKAAFETIGDNCSHLNNFCTVMEHIFIHRIQVRWALFGGSDSVSFWPLISRLAPPITITSVSDMETIHTDTGKCRAWIRLMLVQKRLSHFTASLLRKQDILQSEYQSEAFLLSEEFTVLAGTLNCLDTIDFNLCLRDHNFDLGERREIDYSSYLVFQQSSSSQVDDFFEEQKLSSNRRVSFPWQPEIWAGSDELEEEVGRRGGLAAEGETPSQLREMLKTEREQKNYFEELVSMRDNQLSRLQLELTSLAEEGDKQRAELEEIILELQQQLERKQTDLRALQQQQHKYQSSSSTMQKPRTSTLSQTSSPPPSPSINTNNNSSNCPSSLSPSYPTPSETGGRLRNSSFSVFSGFLGSRNNI